MQKFDTRVQLLKYKILKSVAKACFDNNVFDRMDAIVEELFPDDNNNQRASALYLNREVAKKRIRIALGGNLHNKNSIEVIPLACNECPIGGYEVTNACQGCLAHKCQDSCKFGAISIDINGKAHIDKDKCKECGMCSKNCPYGAIVHLVRPCKIACKVDALTIDENQVAKIDNSKCISCGACAYMCPFGAIMDKSCLINSIEMIKASDHNKKYKVYAIVAPAIASQFKGISMGKLKSAIKEIGFYDMIEVAYGADKVALEDTEEVLEKGFVTTSCCPAFVKYIEINFPDMVKNISTSPSPMVRLAKHLKEKDKNCKVVFIGPCTAKKQEIKRPEIKKIVDSVMTFEELNAMIDAKEIDLENIEESQVNDATYYGRIFARSGGVTEAVQKALKELGREDIVLKPEICNGIEACKVALLKKQKGLSDTNLIEGMACVGGCVAGAGCFSHSNTAVNDISTYAKSSDKDNMKENTKNM